MLEVKAPLAGKIIKIYIAEGETIQAEEAVAILESMKMELTIRAPVSGAIKEVNVKPNDIVHEGDIIAVIAESNS